MCSVKDTGITPGLEPTSKCGAAKLKVPMMILTLEIAWGRPILPHIIDGHCLQYSPSDMKEFSVEGKLLNEVLHKTTIFRMSGYSEN